MKNLTDCCRNSKGLLQSFTFFQILFCFALFTFVALPWNSAMAQVVQCDLDSQCPSDGDACTIEFCQYYDPPLPVGRRGFCNTRPGTCDDGNPCTTDFGVCQGSFSCSYDNAGCLCPGATCDDGNACTIDYCLTLNPPSGSYLGRGTCRHNAVSCADSDPCTNDGACDVYLGGCPPKIPAFCNDNNPCTTDFCSSPAGCIHGTFCPDFNECTEDICTDSGCVHIPIVCDDGSVCTSDACDPLTGCVYQDCDDNDNCTNDICDNGNCIHEDRCPDNSLCYSISICNSATGTCSFNGLKICANTNLCTDEACDPATGQCATIKECNSPECCDDGTLCTDDICYNGFCLHPVIICAGDVNNCTNDFCLDGLCVHPSICDDHNPCTVDHCDGNQSCTYSNKVCADDNVCTSDACVPDSVDGCVFTLTPDCCASLNCDDNLLCTIDFCDPALGCRYLPRTCDDATACTDDNCSAVTGLCVYTPNNCNDQTACTEDVCVNGVTCTNTAINCADTDLCTQDGCDVITGCYNNPWCVADGDPCTIDTCIRICNPADCILCPFFGEPYCSNCNNCANGPPTCFTIPKNCDDGNACTQDVCDNGNCQHTPVLSGACTDDGNACTDDVCNNGVCEHPNNNVSCTDEGDLCTQDICNGGACSHPAVVCASDGNGCTQESCEPSTGCFSYPPCLDFDACTEDICHAGVCQYIYKECTDNNAADCDYDICVGGFCNTFYIPDGSLCDGDGNACTLGTCSSGDCTFENSVSNEPCTDDGNVCTDDFCDAGICEHPFKEGPCTSDNNICTADYCSGGNCTHPAIAGPCAGDGNDCTSDYCSGGDCDHYPIICFDDDLCTSDFCDAGTCRYPPIDCSDGIPCTIDNCINGVCSHDSSNCPVDCVVSEWSDWSSCNASCGGGTQCRTRTVLVRSENGGAECAVLQECRMCNEQSCDPCFGVPALTVKNLTLMYEHLVGEVGPLIQGQVIDKDTLCRFNIRAEVCPALIGSVKFQLTGAQNMTKIETVAPYAAFGDSPAGDYNPWSPPVGNYTLKVTGYTGANATGTAGPPIIIQFSVIDATPGTATNCARPQINCTALNCNDNNACTTDDCHPQTGCVHTPLNCNDSNACTSETCVSGTCTYVAVDCNDNNGCTTDQCNASTGCFYTAKNCNDNNGCTTDGCNPTTGLCTNNPIICNDNNTCTTDNCNPSLGCTYTPGASCCILNTDCNDNNLCTVDVCNSGTCVNTLVSQRVVTSFTLINASTDADIGPIDNGSVIYLGITPNVNIRANLCTNTGTESIRFKVNSNSNFRTESDIPYALAGDAPPGDYHKWNVTPGVYTITATPYAGNNATSTVGTPKTITITVINGIPKMSGEEEFTTANQEDVELAAYPNPFSDKLNIEFSLLENSRVKLEVFSLTGQRLAALFEGDVASGELKKVEYNPMMSCDCMVIYRLQTEKGTYYGKAIMMK